MAPIGLRGGHPEAHDEREMWMREGKRPGPDPADPAAEDVELLARDGLRRVGEEGIGDVRHGSMVVEPARRPIPTEPIPTGPIPTEPSGPS